MTGRRDPEAAPSAGGVTVRHPSRRFRVPPRAPRSVAAAIALLAMFLAAAPAFAASGIAVTVSAVVLSKSNCQFNTKAATLAFGDLDPANPVDVTVSAAIGFRCNGGPPISVFLVTDDDGLSETGPDGNRMRHGILPGTFLPYAFSANPGSGSVARNTPQTLTVTGAVRGADYQSAAPGDYSDTVLVSINP